MKRTPPDILITTPESLYLMITSQVREILTGVEAVIVDEIHAVAQSKRGSHLALTLERLSHLRHRARAATRAAADRPLGDPAPAGADRGVPGRPEARVRDRQRRDPQGPRPRDRRPGRGHDRARARPRLRHRRRPGDARALPGPHRPGPIESSLDPAANPRSIWPAIYPELLELVREHTSTIIFVNNRRGAERLAKRLNELHNEQPARGAPGDRARRQLASRPPRREARTGDGIRGDRPGPPRLARPRGAGGGRGAAQVGQAAVPGRDLLARARHRHGRRRPRDPGRVAEVGLPRPAARRPRRPPARRGLEGPDLPQVPRRPARVRGGRASGCARARSRRR